MTAVKLDQKKLFQFIVVAFVVLILLSEAFIYIPQLKEHISYEGKIHISGNQVNVSENIRSTFNANIGLSYFITDSTVNLSTIYYYYDKSYPSSFSSNRNWYGLSQHIQSVASARGLNLKMNTVNADQLASYLKLQPNRSSILVIASGVLPDTVLTNHTDLLAPWINNGGTLFWIGGRIGNLTGIPSTASTMPRTEFINKSSDFIPESLLGGEGTFYSNDSRISADFGIGYGYSLTGNGVEMNSLNKTGGISMGRIQVGYTNLADIPFGNGHLVYFSGPLLEDTIVSTSILNILQSNLLHIVKLVNSSLVQITKDIPYSHYKLMSLDNSTYSARGYYFCTFAVQTDYLGTFSNFSSVQIK